VIEPSDTHDYQPLWTLVGGGRAPLKQSRRGESSVMPRGVHWVKDRAETVDPEAQAVTTAGGQSVSYDYLVVCPDIQLDWGKVPGMADALLTPAVSTNYSYELAPKTWELIKGMRSGTAVFTMPAGPIKCAGAPQKIAYLAADHWRQQGVLDDIRVVLVLPTPGMFGVPEFAAVLEQVVARYGIEVHKNSELVEVDPHSRQAVIADNAASTKGRDHLQPHARRAAAERPRLGQAQPPGRPGQPRRLRRDRQEHDAAHPLPERVRARRRQQQPQQQDRSRQPQAGARRRQEPHVRDDGRDPHRVLRRVRLLPAHHRPGQDAAGGVRLHDEAAPELAAAPARRAEGAQGHVDLKRYGLPFMYWNLMLKGRA